MLELMIALGAFVSCNGVLGRTIKELSVRALSRQMASQRPATRPHRGHSPDDRCAAAPFELRMTRGATRVPEREEHDPWQSCGTSLSRAQAHWGDSTTPADLAAANVRQTKRRSDPPMPPSPHRDRQHRVDPGMPERFPSAVETESPARQQQIGQTCSLFAA